MILCNQKTNGAIGYTLDHLLVLLDDKENGDWWIKDPH